ncbi:hypothetical protein HZH68_007845 [Vespula germanica]|uniref:Uncharacterized protein n=1 Tax=Vespula germanica TaxID=30212 RepID=A0A834K346_VESGE|nr:hypothetical protein HZH68_007845 [Vespula germanica]
MAAVVGDGISNSSVASVAVTAAAAAVTATTTMMAVVLQISRGVERTVVSIGQSRPRDRQWIYHIQQGSLHRGQRRRQVPLIRYVSL